jgi:hypothetical protein
VRQGAPVLLDGDGLPRELHVVLLRYGYLEKRILGTCNAPYSCVSMYELCRVARAFDPNFAFAFVDPAFVDALVAITPLGMHDLLPKLKQELPQYLSAAAAAPAFNQSDVNAYTESILRWWRTNGCSFPTWSRAALVVFALSPNSASCERVFSLLKIMFTEQQRSSLGDYIRAAGGAHAQVQQAHRGLTRWAGWLSTCAVGGCEMFQAG